MCTSSPPKPKATPSVPIIQPEIQNQQAVQAGQDEMRRRQAAGGAASTIIAGQAGASTAAPAVPTTSAKTLLGS